ncbi:hypothetical protein [Paraburkholderia gardini]|uniref:hypothetical protein n=1 Tax=Paraburkholderia gardini TaxID=2823469 RepID=UPI001E32336E|nr:hypothetical protein [Paraburkholderia gardini]
MFMRACFFFRRVCSVVFGQSSVFCAAMWGIAVDAGLRLAVYPGVCISWNLLGFSVWLEVEGGLARLRAVGLRTSQMSADDDGKVMPPNEGSFCPFGGAAFCFSGFLAFPCFAFGLLASPLCGAAPTFLWLAKEK